MRYGQLVPIAARVEEVKDGDTVQVKPKGNFGLTKTEWVRIRGLDAPEQSDSNKAERDFDRIPRKELFPLGEAATDMLRESIGGKEVFLLCERREGLKPPYLSHNHMRLLAYVTLGKPDGDDLGAQMITKGYALVWPRGNSHPKYTHPRIWQYLRACHKAQNDQNGLWKKGLWKLCPLQADACSTQEFRQCVRNCHPACNNEDDADKEMAAQKLFSALPADGTACGRRSLLQELDWDKDQLSVAEERLIIPGLIGAGKGQGGTLYRCDNDLTIFLSSLPKDGATISNLALREELGWGEGRYLSVREALVQEGFVGIGRGQGGTVFRVK